MTDILTHPYKHVLIRFLLPLLLTPLLASCSGIITSTVIEPAVGNLQKQSDLELVCEGAPAYLLMIDSMIAAEPNDEKLLLIGTQSYIGYLNALQVCNPKTNRLPALADKAHLYSKRLLLLHFDTKADEKQMAEQLENLSAGDVPPLFWGGIGWLSWILQQQGSPAAMADLVVVEKVMQRVLELDPSYQAGGAHLFMGGYLATKPRMLGGNPELARVHFEKALELGDRKFLITQVSYAETYARAVFDKGLHNRLLKEVLAYELDGAPDYTLSNQVAKRKAEKLLEDNYFLD